MILPRIFGPPAQAADIKVSPELLAISASQPDEALQKLQTSGQGLSSAEAERRLKEHGPNVVAQDKRHSRLKLLGRALVNPLVILLSVLAAISALTGDFRAASVMMVMVVLGVVLRFVQEARADTAAAKLKAMISVTATVVRDGEAREIPLAQLVPGDVVQLAAGDMIPADVRLLSCKDLFLIQASLTGRVVPGGEVRRPGGRSRAWAAGTEEHLFPGHQRRERRGHGGGRGHRPEDLPGQHGQRHW